MTTKELLKELITEMTEEQATQLLNIFYIINPKTYDTEKLTDEELQAINEYNDGKMEFLTSEEVYKQLGITL